jgi:methionyl-tRNA synthetase
VKKIKGLSKEIGSSLMDFKLRKALRDIVSFGKEGNVYLNEKAPWHLIKKDKKAAGHVFNICAQAVYALAVVLAPFIPDTSQKILSYLNAPELSKIQWDSIYEDSIQVGQIILKPEPLFQKLDIKSIQNKLSQIRKNKNIRGGKRLVSYDYFKELDIRVAKVESVEKVPKADKLYKVGIDLGTEKRTLIAGLADYYKPEELLGKKIVVLTNLEPRELRGILSEGMLLAAVEGDKVSILSPDKDIPLGARIE